MSAVVRAHSPHRSCARCELRAAHLPAPPPLERRGGAGSEVGVSRSTPGAVFLTEKSGECHGQGWRGGGMCARASMRAHVCAKSKRPRHRNARGRKTLHGAIHHSGVGGGGTGRNPSHPTAPRHALLTNTSERAPPPRAWPSISDRQASRPSVIRATAFINSSGSK